MSKYYLKAGYDIESLKFCKTEDAIVVDIPMLLHGKLNYGLYHFNDQLFCSLFQLPYSTWSKTVLQIKVLRFCILLKNP